jgi:hypothetical protein
MISSRTKSALSAAKAKGVKLGNPNLEAAREVAVGARVIADDFAASILPVVAEIQATSATTLRTSGRLRSDRRLLNPTVGSKAVVRPVHGSAPRGARSSPVAKVGVGPICASLGAAEAHMAETRKLAAILCSDVVCYSRLAGADEDRILSRLRALRSDLIDPTIAVHNGRVVKGDDQK